MTQKIAIVFPGQGSQSVGMMQSFYTEHAVVRQTYQEANDTLGIDLWSITANGPAETLNETINTQPAMLTAGVATYRAIMAQYALQPSLLAGHSLGEYTALVASGQLAFTDALLLARKRAESMQQAVPHGQGAMAAILGLEIEKIRDICTEISTESQGVWAANDNSPGQTVIAGHTQAVEAACEALKAAGAKRAMILPVSVPSHCPLMQPAADTMKSALLMTQWAEAKTPVIHNADVSQHNTTEDLISALVRQLIAPVRWVETVQYFASQQVDLLIESGPGAVLTGLNKRIDKTMPAINIQDPASLEALAAALN